jgi:hypothetical protein
MQTMVDSTVAFDGNGEKVFSGKRMAYADYERSTMLKSIAVLEANLATMETKLTTMETKLNALDNNVVYRNATEADSGCAPRAVLVGTLGVLGALALA